LFIATRESRSLKTGAEALKATVSRSTLCDPGANKPSNREVRYAPESRPLMSKDNPSLQDLFVTPGSDRHLPKLQQAVDKHASIIKWDAVQDVLADKVLEMIDIPLAGILVSGWKKSREVKEALDSENGDVPLAEHTLKSEHHPYLEVLIKGVPVEKLDFTVTVELILEGFVLSIQDRKIASVRTGRMTGKGSVALKDSVIVEKDFGTVQLPGTIPLAEAIPEDSSPRVGARAARNPARAS
jgi:hypothetical protein